MRLGSKVTTNFSNQTVVSLWGLWNKKLCLCCVNNSTDQRATIAVATAPHKKLKKKTVITMFHMRKCLMTAICHVCNFNTNSLSTQSAHCSCCCLNKHKNFNQWMILLALNETFARHIDDVHSKRCSWILIFFFSRDGNNLVADLVDCVVCVVENTREPIQC